MLKVTVMSGQELKNTAILAAIFGSRMLGLFMVLPILAIYAEAIFDATPVLVGLAAGIYGLMTALLQIPCGWLSDRYGRKPLIVVGLTLFIIGSVVAAFSNSMPELILGRALQGAGAVGSPLLALLADMTREEVRTRAMAFMGISIGFSFILAMMLGPTLAPAIGLGGIFGFSAAFGAICLMLLFFLPQAPALPQTQPTSFWAMLRHPDLWPLNLNILGLHAILTALFLVLPLKIQAISDPQTALWQFYVPVVVIAAVAGLPLWRFAEKSESQKKWMKLALLGLAGSILMIMNANHRLVLMLAGILFFIAFNFLEASLPALISRYAPKSSKGAALGVYSSSQFLGMFLGGLLGGCLQQWAGAWGIGAVCLAFTALGLFALLKRVRSEQWQEA